jgi:hypothetical protein
MCVDETDEGSQENGIGFTTTGWGIDESALALGNMLPGFQLKSKRLPPTLFHP